MACPALVKETCLFYSIVFFLFETLLSGQNINVLVLDTEGYSPWVASGEVFSIVSISFPS